MDPTLPSQLSGNFWTVSLGSLLTMFGGVVTLAALWWRVAQRDQSTQDKISGLNGRMARSELEWDQVTKTGLLTTTAQHERRILECEKVFADVTEMKTDIRWIKEKLNHA